MAKPVIPSTFSLVGPGHVGSSLGHWLNDLGIRANLVAGRRPQGARALAEELGATATDVDQMSTEADDLLLLAVSDVALEEVADSLSARPQAGVVLHVAGALGAETIAALRGPGCSVGTLHPLRAFPEVTRDRADAVGTVYAVDGDPDAMQMARAIAERLGGAAVEVGPEERTLYHFAATFAAGGVVTLLAAAREIADALALPPEVQRGYFELAHQSLRLAEAAAHPAEAITGPIARGDVDLVARQLEELSGEVPDLAPLVAALGEETLRQLSQRSASPATAEELHSILAKVRQRKSFLDR